MAKKGTTRRKMAHLGDQFISLEDVYHAYRKAKADVFFERSQPMALSFCRYEQNLHANLVTLLSQLTDSDPDWPLQPDFIGAFGLIPKGLRVPANVTAGEPHFSLSDPEDAWRYLLRRCGETRPS